MIKYQGTPNITTIVLHHSAVSRSRQPEQLHTINRYHQKKWNDKSKLGWYVGYNFYCEPIGERIQTRLVGEETIAQVGMNCDTPERCKAISYCWGGDFRVEKPTQNQVNDFVSFVREVQKRYPDVVLKQHKDVQPGRTCAHLSDEELQQWISNPSSTKDQQIAQLTKERDAYKRQAKQLIALLQKLLRIINKV